jgi:hypothetical protein
MTPFDVARFVERYVAAWNEPDVSRRADATRELWAPDGLVINAHREYRGHEGVEEAMTRSNELFIARGYRYRAREGTGSHHDGICLLWEMLTDTGEVSSLGANLLLLDRDRRIKLEYQFVER